MCNKQCCALVSWLICPVALIAGACKAKANAEADKQRVTESYTTEAVNQAHLAGPAHFILLCSHVVVQITDALLLKVTCKSVRQVN